MPVEQAIIIKHNGESVPFNAEKLASSLLNSGASESVVAEIIGEIEKELGPISTTKAIYKKAFGLLKKRAGASAARYKLRRAIMELGPTGYPFERFVGRLLHHQGYDVEVGVIVEGKHVSHEVDVVAKKGTKYFMIECKFHIDQNRKCGIQVPLYINSRFLDVKNLWEEQKDKGKEFHEGWIVTNTRFTKDAIKYGTGVGLRLIDWDYPVGGSLKHRIEASGLHPLTCLTSLTKKEKQHLLDQSIVLCSDLVDSDAVFTTANIDNRKKGRVLKEIKALLG